ncbi:vacj lipo domain protein [Orientia tsutsugamushi str. UT76]|nr:vacj lipo domain protein [Orientia tsutsugamushi str. UT76]
MRIIVAIIITCTTALMIKADTLSIKNSDNYKYTENIKEIQDSHYSDILDINEEFV